MYLLCNKIDYIKQEFKDCNAKCNLFKNVPHVCTFVNAYLKTLSLTMLLQSLKIAIVVYHSQMSIWFKRETE